MTYKFRSPWNGAQYSIEAESKDEALVEYYRLDKESGAKERRYMTYEKTNELYFWEIHNDF